MQKGNRFMNDFCLMWPEANIDYLRLRKMELVIWTIVNSEMGYSE